MESDHYFVSKMLDAELNGAMILKIVAGWAATIPLAMLVTVLAYKALLPSYARDAVCAAAGPGSHG